MNSLEGEHIFLRANLEGADDDIASIFQLWEELQLSAVEAALPELDVLSFASTAACFLPIYLKAPPPAPGPVIKDPQSRKSRKSRHKPLDLLALQPEQSTEESTSQYSKPPVQWGSHTSDIWPEQTAEVVYPESTTTLQQTMLRFGLMEDELLRESTSTHQSFQVRDPYPLNIKKRSSNFIPNPFLKDVEDDVTEDDITSNTSQHSWENVERLWDDMDDQKDTLSDMDSDSFHKDDHTSEHEQSSDNRDPLGSIALSPTSKGKTRDPYASSIPSALLHEIPDVEDTADETPIMNLARTWGQNTNSPVFIGFAYLSESFHVAPSTAGFGELNLGIILTAKHRRQGFATEALNLIVPYAFAKLNCHRLQASIMTMPEKNRVVKMFTSLGFAHEGTRRRSFFCGMTHEWKDVTTLAMLDSDHALRRDLDLKAPKTLWDELFTRHERERQDLLRWEERTMMEMECNSTSIKRTSSMETIRMPLYTETDVEASGESEAETEDKFMSGPSSPYPSGSGHLPRPDSPTLSEASFTEIHRDHLSGGDLTDSSWSDLSDAPPPSSSDSEADYSDLGDDDDDMSQTQLLARGSGPNKRRRFLI